MKYQLNENIKFQTTKKYIKLFPNKNPNNFPKLYCLIIIKLDLCYRMSNKNIRDLSMMISKQISISTK